MCATYNGHKNYPTWLVFSFLSEHAPYIAEQKATEGIDAIATFCQDLFLDDDTERLDNLGKAEQDLLSWAIKEVDYNSLQIAFKERAENND